jgi:anthranilate 1,2-dioxygenase small subunit
MNTVAPADDALDVPQPVRDAIARLQTRYVHAIDNDDIERWPGFFAERCVYRIVPRRDYDAGLPMGLWYCDSRGMLEDRVSSLRGVNVYEPHCYRHLLGPTEILGRRDGLWQAETGFAVIRTMHDGDMTVFSAGRYVDAIEVDAGGARFASRTVVTDSWRYDTLIVIPI